MDQKILERDFNIIAINISDKLCKILIDINIIQQIIEAAKNKTFMKWREDFFEVI